MNNQRNINTSALQNSETPQLPNSLTLNSPTFGRPALLELREVVPWPEPVDGKLLLDALVHVLRRFVVLPNWGAETLALWVLHTYLFKFRDVSTYIGIESPEKRCDSACPPQRDRGAGGFEFPQRRDQTLLGNAIRQS